MNRYEKKKNIIQALLEINAVRATLMVIGIVIVPFLIGFLMLKIPYILNVVAPKSAIQHFVLTYIIGLAVICIAYLGYLCILFVVEAIKSINISLHAARIMQYLPLSKEDWERLDAKTDEEAIHILRDLAKTIGYRSDLLKCEELRDQIAESYRAFLVYEKANVIKFNNASGLVLCPDEDFDELLKNAHDPYSTKAIY